MLNMSTATVSSAELPPRERILVAAHDLFYRDGIRATGIDRVIEHSKVTKVTFYRQYPSKNDLVRAYLSYRHEHWMAWLRASLERNMASGASATTAVLSTFEEWWNRPDYRGCAFINSAAELGSSDPEILEIVRQHKADMTSVFEKLLLRGPGRAAKARALALAIDGAIVHAQMGIPVASLLVTLKALVEPVLGD
jgi:AcrR family transcriptional regulator